MFNVFESKDKNNISNFLKDEKAIRIFSQISNLIELWDLNTLNNFINENLNYLNSNNWISNLKIIMENNWEKFYPILWSIFSISSKKKNYELANLFSETTKISEKLLKEIKKLKKENNLLKNTFSKKDEKILKQKETIEILETENNILQEESQYLRPNAKAYSEILKILIENNLSEKWKDSQEVITKIIKWNQISSKLIKWLEQQWIISIKTNWWYWLSPKVKIIMEELANNQRKKKNSIIETTEEIWKSNVIKSYSKIEEYTFQPIDEEEIKRIDKEKEIKQDKSKLIEDENSDIFAEITWEFLVKIDELKKSNKSKENKIKEIEENLNKKELELQKQAEEIEKLKRELEDIKKSSWWTTTPAHIMKKAHKSYKENK